MRINLLFNLQAPLEQFEVVPLNLTNNLFFNFLTTNFLIINTFILLSVTSLMVCNNKKRTGGILYSFFLPNAWQKTVESLIETISQIITDNLSKNNEKYFPIIAMLFMFILLGNLSGLIPYSVTITSHLIITFTLSFSVFIGINLLTIKKYKLEFFSLFMPANTTFFLAILLVPVEFVAYIAKPISLGLRLFINLMAGHSLLKVVAGLSWNIITLESVFSLIFVVPIIVLTILFGLELAVAFIQTYVFIMLTCIYLQDNN